MSARWQPVDCAANAALFVAIVAPYFFLAAARYQQGTHPREQLCAPGTAHLCGEAGQCDGGDLSVMKVLHAVLVRHVEPQLVYEIDILIGQARRMRTEIKLLHRAVRRDDVKGNLSFGFVS